MIRPAIKTLWITSLLVGASGVLAAQEMDEALRDRDLSRVLGLLQPGESAEAEEPAPVAAPEARPVLPVPVPPPAVAEPEAVPQLEAPRPAPTPHRVTVVSSDGMVREAQPAPTLIVPPAQTPASVAPAAPPPATGAPAQVQALPAVTRVPKVAPPRSGAVAAPPRMPRPAPASMPVPDDPEEEAEEGEVVLPEKDARTRAAGLLSALVEPEIPEAVEPEPADEPADKDEAEETDPDEGLEPEGEATEQPLGLLDQLAQRLGTPAPAAAAPSPTAPSPAQVTPPDPASAPQPDPSASPMDQRMDGLRAELDRLLRTTRVDLGLPPQAPGHVAALEPGGWRYSGQWRSGKMDGVGTWSYADGWSFTGDWREGRISGNGVLRYPDGSQYDGEWADGKMDGFGTFLFPDGWRYVGQWRAGRMHGTGELIHPNAVPTATP